MASIFPARDPRSEWGGYRFKIHPNEFQAKSKQKPEKVHIHIEKGTEGREGDLRIYLISLKVEEKIRGISRDKWRDIKEFIQKNLTDIKEKVKEELARFQLGHLVD